MRVVSLCPSITETLIVLGARESLVGVTRFCAHPRGEVDGLQRVGGTKNPDLSAILSLSPDVVLANAEENRAADIAELSRTLHVDVSHPCSPAEVPDVVRHHARLAGVRAAGAEWAARLERRIASVRRAAPFTFSYLVWKDPWMAAARGTYISALLELAGGRNVFDDPSVPYPSVSEATVCSHRPELLVLPDEPYRFGDPDREAWSARLPSSRVVLASGDDLCWHGVRTLRGIDAVEALAWH